jgi:hypothetical protein
MAVLMRQAARRRRAARWAQALWDSRSLNDKTRLTPGFLSDRRAQKNRPEGGHDIAYYCFILIRNF